MRVITGTARGRRLREPEGMATRPTTDNVKESMFNLIQFDIEGRRVLDLFAGTGQLGIEALSRGARSAVFVDESRAAVQLVRANLALCRLQGDGGGLEIGFNNRYLMDALRYAPADSVKIELNTGISPAIIVPADGEENFLYMVLPVRLKAN